MANDPYKAAKKRVKAKKGFYGHLTSYVITNVMMMLLMAFNGAVSNWIPVALMWGIGLAWHYFGVFGLPFVGNVNSKEWEERQLEKELEKQGYRLKEEEKEETESLELPDIEKEPEKKYRDEDFV
ncbi:MAG: 2TM domain-containing protein [Saprospiraceae bacterium]|nr:2TM domain-containing protein [Saprospiraceae bacterium]